MKKFLLIIICFALCFAAMSCKTDDRKNADTTAYDIKMSVHEDLTLVEIEEEVSYFNNTGTELESIVFNLYPNAYNEKTSHPAYFNELSRYGGIEIKSITMGETSLKWTLENENSVMTIALPSPLKNGDTAVIIINAVLSVPESDLRLGVSDEILKLGNFYPIAAVYENGAFRKDCYSKIGDPFYAETAAYSFEITCPSDMVIASSAKEATESVNGEIKTATLKSDVSRDFAIVMSDKFKVATAKAGTVDVKYYYTSDSEPTEQINTAVSAINTFGTLIGEYPSSVYTVVEMPFYYGGMEYSNLVYINSLVSDKNSVIVHETAHQWFGCGVGSDAINQSWQDEALVSFLTNYYYGLTADKTAYTTLRDADKTAYNNFVEVKKKANPEYTTIIERPIYDFNTNYEYSMVVYTKGSLMFDAIYQIIGDKKLSKALKEYYTTNVNQLASPDAFYSAFKKASNQDVTAIAKAWLGDGIVIATFGSIN